MKNKKLVIIISILLLLGFGAFFLFKKNGNSELGEDEAAEKAAAEKAAAEMALKQAETEKAQAEAKSINLKNSIVSDTNLTAEEKAEQLRLIAEAEAASKKAEAEAKIMQEKAEAERKAKAEKEAAEAQAEADRIAYNALTTNEKFKKESAAFQAEIQSKVNALYDDMKGTNKHDYSLWQEVAGMNDRNFAWLILRYRTIEDFVTRWNKQTSWTWCKPNSSKSALPAIANSVKARAAAVTENDICK